jgi:dihydrofolate synthase/folylpolyglutamate synthase
MTFDDALAYWYGRIDYEKKPAKPGDLKLDRMRALLKLLADPQDRLRIVHVAGTKGKGSTSAMLASVLRAAGYRVGLFTSPHLCDVTERIQVDGVPIAHEELAARMEEVASAVAKLEASSNPQRDPTFFEIGTALGFLHFICRRVDVAVVEVGLGGRFDSTNVCLPILSIITSISYDHIAQLGATLERIAFEKAGIIKRGRPVVTTAEDPAWGVIARIGQERKAPIISLGHEFTFQYVSKPYPRRSLVQVRGEHSWPAMELGLYGKHQAVNAASVIAAIEQLRHQGLPVPESAVIQGLASVNWPARLEVIGERPLIVLDCAHNVASAQALVDTIAESFRVAGKKRLIFAISSDKQVPEILDVLASRFDEFYVTRYANNPRCVPPEQIAEILKGIDPRLRVSVIPSALEALTRAKTDSTAEDLIVISGSVFLAGEIRAILS